MQFSHISVITEKAKQGEVFVEATRVWVTDFRLHPFRVEWLRFEPDSQVTGPVREQPHVAYQVASIEDAAQGLRVLLEPFRPRAGLRVGFYLSADGTVVEFMEYDQESSDA